MNRTTSTDQYYRVSVRASRSVDIPVSEVDGREGALDQAESELITLRVGDLGNTTAESIQDHGDYYRVGATRTGTVTVSASSVRDAEHAGAREVDTGEFHTPEVGRARVLDARLYAGISRGELRFRCFRSDVDRATVREYVAERVQDAIDGRKAGTNWTEIGRVFLAPDGEVIGHELNGKLESDANTGDTPADFSERATA